jgi:catalase (peroxidase I)
MLLPIKKKYPEVSYGDLWALAGAGEKKNANSFH